MDSKKFSIQLPDHYYDDLRVWARIKGAAPATLAANIVQARIEANREEIRQQLEKIARREGRSPEEVEAEFLNGDE